MTDRTSKWKRRRVGLDAGDVFQGVVAQPAELPIQKMASRQRTDHRWTARGQLADFVLQAGVVRRASQPAVEGLAGIFASSRGFVHLGPIQIEMGLPWVHSQGS